MQQRNDHSTTNCMTLLFFSRQNFNICTRTRGELKPSLQINHRSFTYYNVSKDENPERGNEMDIPSFEGFHAQLDCKMTTGNKNQKQIALV